MKIMNAIIVCILMLVFILGGCQEDQQKTTTTPIKLGFHAPLSGDVAMYGEASITGVQLAVNEINAAGSIRGRKLELIAEDDHCNAKEGTNAATKLITVDKVPIIVGTVCSAATLAAAPIAEQNKVTLISAASSSPDITNAGDYIFRVWPSDTGQAAIMAPHIYNSGYKSVGIIYANSDYNIALKNAFKKNYEKLGGAVLAEETHETDSKDFKTELTKIKSKNPDALYIISYGEGGIIMRQTKELGLTIPMFGSETVGTKEVIIDAGNAAEGVVYATQKYDESNPATKKFMDAYKATFGKDSPFWAISADAYDGVYLAAEGMKQGGVSSEAVKNYLYTVKNYDGAGGMLTMDEHGDPIKDFQLMIIKNEEFEKLS